LKKRWGDWGHYAPKKEKEKEKEKGYGLRYSVVE